MTKNLKGRAREIDRNTNRGRSQSVGCAACTREQSDGTGAETSLRGPQLLPHKHGSPHHRADSAAWDGPCNRQVGERSQAGQILTIKRSGYTNQKSSIGLSSSKSQRSGQRASHGGSTTIKTYAPRITRRQMHSFERDASTLRGDHASCLVADIHGRMPVIIPPESYMTAGSAPLMRIRSICWHVAQQHAGNKPRQR